MKTFASSLIAIAYLASNTAAVQLTSTMDNDDNDSSSLQETLPQFLATSSEIALRLVENERGNRTDGNRTDGNRTDNDRDRFSDRNDRNSNRDRNSDRDFSDNDRRSENWDAEDHDDDATDNDVGANNTDGDDGVLNTATTETVVIRKNEPRGERRSGFADRSNDFEWSGDEGELELEFDESEDDDDRENWSNVGMNALRPAKGFNNSDFLSFKGDNDDPEVQKERVEAHKTKPEVVEIVSKAVEEPCTVCLPGEICDCDIKVTLDKESNVLTVTKIDDDKDDDKEEGYDEKKLKELNCVDGACDIDFGDEKCVGPDCPVDNEFDQDFETYGNLNGFPIHGGPPGFVLDPRGSPAYIYGDSIEQPSYDNYSVEPIKPPSEIKGNGFNNPADFGFDMDSFGLSSGPFNNGPAGPGGPNRPMAPEPLGAPSFGGEPFRADIMGDFGRVEAPEFGNDLNFNGGDFNTGYGGYGGPSDRSQGPDIRNFVSDDVRNIRGPSYNGYDVDNSFRNQDFRGEFGGDYRGEIDGGRGTFRNQIDLGGDQDFSNNFQRPSRPERLQRPAREEYVPRQSSRGGKGSSRGGSDEFLSDIEAEYGAVYYSPEDDAYYAMAAPSSSSSYSDD